VRSKYKWVGIIIILIGLVGVVRPLSEYILKQYFTRLNTRVSVLAQELNREHFAADTTGKDGHYRRTQLLAQQLTECYQSTTKYRLLYLLKKSGLLNDPLLKRELDLVYLAFQGNRG